jgi:hypothetical protein
MNEEVVEKITLGELILALTEKTFRLAHDKERAYQITAFILSDLLYNSEPASKSWH